MWKARHISYTLDFFKPAGTSRGILMEKPAWYVVLEDGQGHRGIGEVGFIPGLSLEDPGEMDLHLDRICKGISSGEMDPRQDLPGFPGIRFALDTALLDLEGEGRGILYSTPFSRGEAGIPINGLIWMGDREYMQRQVKEKLERGFRVLKMKVGALDFRAELKILGDMREVADETELEIRLDANGAWKAWEAGEKMHRLAAFGIHSIEQPLAPGQAEAMAALCRERIIPVALDEELIGISGDEQKRTIMESIRPQYIILKPGLIGGLDAADSWVSLADELGIPWWATSALESNVGLNAIARWAASKMVTMPQGLGTGSLYSNNIPSPLFLQGDELWNGKGDWEYTVLDIK